MYVQIKLAIYVFVFNTYLRNRINLLLYILLHIMVMLS